MRLRFRQINMFTPSGGWPRSRASIQSAVRVPPVPRPWGPGMAGEPLTAQPQTQGSPSFPCDVGEDWVFRIPDHSNLSKPELSYSRGSPPILSSPQIQASPLNPTKQTTNLAKINGPGLQAINSQKRTIEVIPQRANAMQENSRKIVQTARPAAPPSPKRHEKCRKSAQIPPGNHLSTSTPSTT